MFGVRGRRPPVSYAAPAAESRRDIAATAAHSDGDGAVRPVGPEKMLVARVTEVTDPTSFWAQVGEGRRYMPTAYNNFVCGCIYFLRICIIS